jgi:hypothetical protein
MRKLLFILSTVLLILACSTLDLIPAPAPASTPTNSPTASNTPTITQIPTRTSTPTPRDTATLIISDFNTPAVLVTDEAPTFASFTLTPLSPFAPVAPTGGFESVELSQGNIFYGICQPNFTKMTVKVENSEEVRKVYIFFRLESGKKPGDTTPWTGSVTYNDGGGFFLYTLRANNIPERGNFLKAWVHYQFVAEDAGGELIGRTQVYTRNLVLEPCK